MFRLSLICAATSVSLLCGGCASIVSGQNQSVSVTSRTSAGDVSGAKCSLANDKGTWYTTTPGSVTVRRSFNELTINCTMDGQEPGITIAKSTTKGMAFGNILFGGVIGAGVDMSTGAAYDYPEIIIVTMGQTTNQPDLNAKKTAHSHGKSASTSVATATQSEPTSSSGNSGPLNSASNTCNPLNPTCRP